MYYVTFTSIKDGVSLLKTKFSKPPLFSVGDTIRLKLTTYESDDEKIVCYKVKEKNHMLDGFLGSARGYDRDRYDISPDEIEVFCEEIE